MSRQTYFTCSLLQPAGRLQIPLMESPSLRWFYVLMTCVTLWSMTYSFNIYDNKTNIDCFIRATGSMDPDVDTISYGNGTVYARFPGEPIQKIFYFEGFNIAKKKQTETGFESMAREVFVYRDIVTTNIINVWMNPFTNVGNEVFQVTNDPLDMPSSYTNPKPISLAPPDMVAFNGDVFLSYPNVLDPKHYYQYSSGPIYEGVELFQYYANLTTLATTKDPSLKMVGSWYRKGPFLPWMELGPKPGYLVYHQTIRKLERGFEDVAPDILEFVKKYYPQYLKAPNTYSGESETTWTVFKKVIDDRRARGKPDIIIPTVKLQPHPVAKHNSLDPRIVKKAFTSGDIRAFFNGTVHAMLTGQQAVNLFNFEGHIRFNLLDFYQDSLLVDFEIFGRYHDYITGKILRHFHNPITHRYVKVPHFHFHTRQEVPVSSAFSFPLLGLDMVTVLFQQSHTHTDRDTGLEDWAMDMVNINIDNAELDKKSPYFYGTWCRFSSWLLWLQMEKYRGDMVWKSSLYKVDHFKVYNSSLENETHE